jgi:hypothetical protein
MVFLPTKLDDANSSSQTVALTYHWHIHQMLPESNLVVRQLEHND